MGRLDDIIGNQRNLNDVFAILNYHALDASYVLDCIKQALEDVQEPEETLKVIIKDLTELKEARWGCNSTLEVTNSEGNPVQIDLADIVDDVQSTRNEETKERGRKIYAIHYYGTKTYHIQDREGNAKCGRKGTLPETVVIPLRKMNCKRCEVWCARPDVVTFVDV